MLTAARLSWQQRAIQKAQHDRETRVAVVTMNGVKIGVRGVCTKQNNLTFPTHWTVQQCLVESQWIRLATPEEEMEDPQKWWRESEVQPKSLIHSDGTVAFMEDLLGVKGNLLYAVAGEVATAEVQETPCADVDDVSTPRTPDPLDEL